MSWKDRLSIYKSKGQLRTEKYHRRLKKNSPKIETLTRHLQMEITIYEVPPVPVNRAAVW